MSGRFESNTRNDPSRRLLSADPVAAEGSRPPPGSPSRLRLGVAVGGVGGAAPGKDRLCLLDLFTLEAHAD